MLNDTSGKNQDLDWKLEETCFNERYQAKWESILALGNGYLGLRSATEEPYIGQTRNLFVAGTYDKFDETEVTELPNAADPITKTSGTRMDLMVRGNRYTLLAELTI